MMPNVVKTIACVLLLILQACTPAKKITEPSKILVFSATMKFRHKSIPNGKIALLKMGSEKKWQVDTTEDAGLFTESNLKRYATVVFLNTTGNILNTEQQSAFQRYIQAGGGFVGIHAAADTENDWPWYNNLVGAYFESHPTPQAGLYKVINRDHPSVSFMRDTFRWPEEIYNFKSFKKEILNVLITLDEKSINGGKMGEDHPVAWYHHYDGGRAFYTALGHFPEAFADPLFLQHIEGAIKWAMGKERQVSMGE